MQIRDTDLAHTRRDQVLEDMLIQLRQMIADAGGLPPERLLAEQLSVKRHILRKALQVLRDLGELEPARAGRRATSNRAEPLPSGKLVLSTNPLEVMEMRMMLEPAMARLAALRASPAEISRILQTARSPSGMSPSEADQLFHRAIAAGSRNSLATEVYVLLHQVQHDSRLRFAESDSETTIERVNERDAEHQRIAEAIASRDADRAERAMREHLSVVQRKIINRLSTGAVNAA